MLSGYNKNKKLHSIFKDYNHLTLVFLKGKVSISPNTICKIALLFTCYK